MLHKTVVLITTAILILSSGIPGYETQISPILFYHEKTTCPELEKLRDLYNYDDFCKKGKSEFEQMLLLKEWVFRKLEYRLVYRDVNLRNSLEILRLDKKKKPFICTAFSALMLQGALSMGWTARYIFLKKPGPRLHAGIDIWSNQYKKWIYFDPSWNIHLEKNGSPLSIVEIRNEWIKNNGRALSFVYSTGKKRKTYNFKDLPVKKNYNGLWARKPISKKWFLYTYHIAIVGRNNFFSHDDGSGRNIWNPIYIIRDDLNRNDKTWSLRNKTVIDDMKALFHDINRVDITIKNQPGNKNTRTIYLDRFGKYTYTPNFSHFEISINGKDWQKSFSRFSVDLKEKKTLIRARTVNLSGVKGPVTELSIPHKKR